MKKNKFSIIVPVYNTSKVLQRCFDSIFNQTYNNYEVIVVNDGSTDDSLNVIKKYKDKIVLINQKNEGLSMARNNGVKKATGDYILFVDSDDSINKDLLKELNNNITDEDLIRYQIKNINNNKEIPYKEVGFKELNGIEAFKKIAKYHYVETATCYAYKKSYYIENKFSFIKGAYHEDFGLIPEVIIKANVVTSLEYIGYNYYYNEGSITDYTSYDKEIKKAYDVLKHYERLIDKSEDKFYKSFLANAVLLKSNSLKNNDKKDYLNIIKELKVINNLLDNTIGRKLKKISLKLFPNIFIKRLK